MIHKIMFYGYMKSLICKKQGLCPDFDCFPTRTGSEQGKENSSVAHPVWDSFTNSSPINGFK